MSARVVVLAGGPDAEREVSLASGRAVAAALREHGGFRVALEEIGMPTAEGLAAVEADAFFPALHGPFGEGGPMQRLLEADGRPYVGSGPAASKRAIDKVLTKTIAAGLGIAATPTAAFDAVDPACPLGLPVVVKPVFEGSTIGLHVCRSEEEWRAAHASTAASGRTAMVEPFIAGRELTVGLADLGSGLEALPIIEIVPAEGLYDYEAKYARDDTRYGVDPALPGGVGERIRRETLALAGALEVRDLCRADFLLDDKGEAWLLEVNTMPGFTPHSLVPMAARAMGVEMPALCAALVERALERRQEGAASGGRTVGQRREEG